MKRTLAICLLSSSIAIAAPENDERAAGQVQIPLDVYNQLLAAARTPGERPAPLGFALGNATVRVSVSGVENRRIAEVTASLPIEVFESQWVLVPVLPPGTAIARATLGGNPAQLVATPQGLAYGTNVKGSSVMELVYAIDATAAGPGYLLALPVPQASSIQLTATIPGSGLDVSVIPAATVRTSSTGDATSLQATVPSTSGIQIAWRGSPRVGPSLSRAIYRGDATGKAVHWRVELRVEHFTDEAVTVPLLPCSLTLEGLTLDGKEPPILIEGDRFATVVRGRGSHTVVASFQTSILKQNGPPSTELVLPEAPVSRLELTLPGRKEVTASPSTSVVTRVRGAVTEATVSLPLTERVTLSWSEAVPEAARRELRANASLYHVLQAEEGVLYGRAHVIFDVQHGATSRIELSLPPVIEVNQVTSETGAISDWRVETQNGRRILRVFLDRELSSALHFVVDYDRSLVQGGAEALPLLSALGVGRQKGMIALVSTRDRELDPVEPLEATAVGENQLPPFVREGIEKTIAHTLKYGDAPPAIRATAVEPQRAAGRFDADVDTLVSLGDVAIESTATIEIHVKSGGVDRIDLTLPEGANLLSLSAPSLRTHRVVDGLVEIELTQEIEGDFRIEASYERLLEGGAAEVDAGILHVRGAEVEQGRIAVEAASAVEVAPSLVSELSPLDVSELPRQLVLRTSHPILHAFRYLRAEPAPRLSLAFARHETASVQEAIVDRAEHRTLFTRDGLAVTTSRFLVRNTRRQFLRIALPEGSEIWSVFVAGQAEKPAVADAAFLIRIVSGNEAFPVEVVHATPIPRMGRLGSVSLRPPRTDLLVTETRWDWYLPEGVDYRKPSTNMNVVVEEDPVAMEELAREVPEAFRIQVPVAGIHYAFRMLYANHGDIEARVRIPYASRAGFALAQLASLLGVFLLYQAYRLSRKPPIRIAIGVAGAVLFFAPAAVFGASLLPGLVLAGGLALHAHRHEVSRFFYRSRAAAENG